MKTKTLIGVLGILLPMLNATAQKITPLMPGEKLPLLSLRNIINTDDSVVRLPAAEDKYTLIDYWGTTCGSCIASFPHLDSIARHYSSRLNILLVTDEPRSKAEAFLHAWQSTHGHILAGIPIVYGDTLLVKIFPRAFLPTYVWLAPNGKYIGTTLRDFVTEETIFTLSQNHRRDRKPASLHTSKPK